MAIAADKGLAMEQVDWNALPVKSLDGQLHLQFHSSETDLYGKEKGSVTRENTVPIRTGALPTAGIDARIVDIISPSEIVILAEKKLYTLKKGEQITISREFDGYEDHEGVVWSTDTVTYTITFP